MRLQSLHLGDYKLLLRHIYRYNCEIFPGYNQATEMAYFFEEAIRKLTPSTTRGGDQVELCPVSRF